MARPRNRDPKERRERAPWFEFTGSILGAIATGAAVVLGGWIAANVASDTADRQTQHSDFQDRRDEIQNAYSELLVLADEAVDVYGEVPTIAAAPATRSVAVATDGEALIQPTAVVEDPDSRGSVRAMVSQVRRATTVIEMVGSDAAIDQAIKLRDELIQLVRRHAREAHEMPVTDQESEALRRAKSESVTERRDLLELARAEVQEPSEG
jgi:hypothetical protein